MSVYVSRRPIQASGGAVRWYPFGEEPAVTVDVAVSLLDGTVRLGVWPEDEWEPSAYLTPAQAIELGAMLIAAGTP